MMNQLLILSLVVVSTSTIAAPIKGSVHTSTDITSETASVKAEPADLHHATLKISELSKSKVKIEVTVNTLDKSIAESKKKFDQCQLQLDTVTKLKKQLSRILKLLN